MIPVTVPVVRQVQSVTVQVVKVEELTQLQAVVPVPATVGTPQTLAQSVPAATPVQLA